MMTPTAEIIDVVIPPGIWTVDPAASSVGFRVKTMWGLVVVHGVFNRFGGTLVAEDYGIRGELVIDAATIDTKNAARDAHLRSADFFDVEHQPEIVFSTETVSQLRHGISIAGDLRIGDRVLRLVLPVTVEEDGDRLHLRTTASVARERVGLGWNKHGMIRGAAHLDVGLVLTHEAE